MKIFVVVLSLLIFVQNVEAAKKNVINNNHFVLTALPIDASLNKEKNKWLTAFLESYLQFRLNPLSEITFLSSDTLYKLIPSLKTYYACADSTYFSVATKSGCTHILFPQFDITKNKTVMLYLDIVETNKRGSILTVESDIPIENLTNGIDSLLLRMFSKWNIALSPENKRFFDIALASHSSGKAIKTTGELIYQYRTDRKAKIASIANDFEKTIESDPSIYFAHFPGAITLMQAGKYEKSAKYLQELLDITTVNTTLYLLLSESYRKAGNLNKALEISVLCDKKGFQTVPFLLERGRILDTLKQIEYAYKAFNQVLYSTPDNIEALLYCAKYNNSISKYSIALPLAERCIDKDSLNGTGYFEKGKSLSGLNKMDLAISEFKTAVKYTKSDASIMEYLSDSYTKVERYSDAVLWYKKALELKTDDPNILLKLSKAYENAGDKGEALAVLKNKQHLFTNNIEYKKTTGLLELANKNYSSAQSSLEQYIIQKPNDYESMFALGNACFHGAKYDIAIKYLQSASKLTSNKLECQFIIAQSHLLKNDPLSAQKVLQQLLKERQIRGAHALLGETWYIQNNFREALLEFTKERELHGNNPDIQEKIAKIQYLRGFFAASITEFNKLLQIEEKNPEARYYLAIMLLKDKKLSEAEKFLEKAIQYGPGNKDLLVSIADEYYSLKKHQQSKTYFDKVLALAPDDEDALLKSAISNIEMKNDSIGAEQYIKLFTINNTKYSNLLADAGRIFKKIKLNPNAIAAYKLFIDKGFTDISVNTDYAVIEYENKNYKKVNELLNGSAIKSIKNTSVLLILADSRFKTEDFKGCDELASVILAIDNNNREAIYLSASSMEKVNDLHGSIKQYNRYLQLSPDDRFTEIAFHLGQLYEKTEQTDKALSQYDSNRKLYKNDLRNHERLSILYMKKSNWSKAQEVLETALSITDSISTLQKMLAQTYTHLGISDKSIMLYRKYLYTNNTDAAGWKELGIIYFNLQKYADAVQALSNAVTTLTTDFETHVTLGKSYIELNNYRKAIAPVARARAIAPSNLSVFDLYAKCYRNLNETSSLMAILDEWNNLDPKRFDIKLELGSLYMEKGDIDKAISILKSALQFVPTEQRPHILLSQAYELKGIDSLRFYHLTKASKSGTECWELNFQYARYYISKNNINKGEEYLNKVLVVKPNHSQSHYELAMIYYTRNETQNAKSEIDKALSYDPFNSNYQAFAAYLSSTINEIRYSSHKVDSLLKEFPYDPYVFYWAGLLAKHKQDYKTAMQYFTKALQLKPDFSKCYEITGDIYVAHYNYKEAVANYLFSLEKGGYNPLRAFKLANALAYNFKYNEAKDFYESVLKNSTPSGEILYRVIVNFCNMQNLTAARNHLKMFSKDDLLWMQLAQGILYESDKNFESAITAYSIAGRLSPGNPLINAGYGRIFADQKMYDSAIVHFKLALKDSVDTKNINNLANTFKTSGQVDSAIKYYKKLDAIFPEFPTVQLSLAAIYAEQKDHDGAIAILQKGRKYHNENPSVHFMLGKELEAINHYEEAISSYQVSLKIGNGQPIDALKKIGNIYFEKLVNVKKAKEFYKKFVKAGGDKKEIEVAMKTLDKS
jgi:superkiller protein 3